jgi:glycosyltransferase involved in cell wall biosynthesis
MPLRSIRAPSIRRHMIYADQRWIGNHGIGRFARRVLEGLDYRGVGLRSHPAAPLDSWRLARTLAAATSSDLFFSPGYNTPLSCSAKLVFTIHDLSHVYCPQNSSLLIRLYYSLIMKRACRWASRVLTVSEFTRSQIAEWSGIPAGQVVNVGCGVDPSYGPEGDTYNLPYRYFLCVSNRKPHKNEFRTVEAFAKADIEKRIHLVFTGEPTAVLARHIERSGIAERVRFMGSVPEEKLPALYRGAEALLFVSLYEGFGLPLLEAMACGTPVVTSNVTALPETAGNAALLVDPTSVDEIAAAITRLSNDRSVHAQLREHGLKRAAGFTWEATRCKVHEVLNEVRG